MTPAERSGGAFPPPDALGEANLRDCLRGLMALLALPGLCSGKTPGLQLDIFAEALERLLGVEVCAIGASFTAGEPLLWRLRVGGVGVDADVPGWRDFVAGEVDPLKSEPQVTDEQTALGVLRVARVAMTYFGGAGFLVVASARPGFPEATETVLLRAAASLAGTALANARLMHERESALRAKDDFLAMLGHELRNPLAPIVTALSIQQMRFPEGLSPELQIVERQVRHLVGLVDDLLDVARITRGKIELAPEDVETAIVVARAIEMTRPLMEQRKHELRIDVPATGLPIRVDVRRMAQVISNLLVNAAKYTPERGHIDVSAARTGDTICVRVRDDGMGIEPALLPRLFAMFEQGATTLDRGHGGLGVGLAIVKSLVASHSGSIEVNSQGPGQGAEFVVKLPVPAMRVASPPTTTAPPEAPVYAPERVLVVDDNPDAATLIATLLHASGHEVCVANDAPSALEICARWTPTVVVLDIGLPVIDGYQLATYIRDRTGERCPRIIALTGYGLEADRQKSASVGIEAHLVKPVAKDVLLAAVASLRTQREAPQH